MLDKTLLVSRFQTELRRRLEEATRASEGARDGTRVDGSHRPANRGERAAVTSQGYLSLGLSQRAETLQRDLKALETVDLSPARTVRQGAWFAIETEDGATEHYLLLPGGEGIVLQPGTPPTLALSPQSPLAQALEGAEVGDGAEIRRGNQTVEVELTAIA